MEALMRITIFFDDKIDCVLNLHDILINFG